jgi:tRNA A37 threonylcarbamoyladenosine dehydratase
MFYNKENENIIFDKDYDFVIDAIDTLSLKWELIKTCLERKIEFISSMGMGNRRDLTKIEITSLDKTYNDPVSKKLREFARKDKIDLKKIKVVFSKEEAVRTSTRAPSSIIFTPAVAGLLMGQYILEKIIKDLN